MELKGVLIAVSDMAVSKEFYRRVLGLTVTADFGANVTLSDTVFLQTKESWRGFIGKEVGAGANDAELYFETDDMDSFLEKLRSFDDIRYVHVPLTHSWGQQVVRIYDPDAHIIEIAERIAIVARRFISQGLTVEETARRMDVPMDFLRQCIDS